MSNIDDDVVESAYDTKWYDWWQANEIFVQCLKSVADPLRSLDMPRRSGKSLSMAAQAAVLTTMTPETMGDLRFSDATRGGVLDQIDKHDETIENVREEFDMKTRNAKEKDEPMSKESDSEFSID